MQGFWDNKRLPPDAGPRSKDLKISVSHSPKGYSSFVQPIYTTDCSEGGTVKKNAQAIGKNA